MIIPAMGVSKTALPNERLLAKFAILIERLYFCTKKSFATLANENMHDGKIGCINNYNQ